MATAAGYAHPTGMHSCVNKLNCTRSITYQIKKNSDNYNR